MLRIYRRHQNFKDKNGKVRLCKYANEPYARRCTCPVWLIGRDSNGIAVRESLKTRSWERAEEKLRERENIHIVKGEPVTVAEAVRVFLLDIGARGWQPGTVRKFHTLLNVRLLPFCAERKLTTLEQLDQTAITLFRASWPDAPLTNQKNIERLRSFFRFAIDHDWVRKNPATNLHVRVVPEQKEPFTPEEMVRILGTCAYVDDGHGRVGRENAVELRTLVLFLRHSGFRISDAVKLEKRALVPSPVGEGWSVEARQQKSKRSVYVPLPDHVVDALLALPREGAYFFWTGRGKLQNACTNWRDRLDRLFKLCEKRTEIAFTNKAHPHRFRHTFAAEALRAGVPIEIVSVLLGHSSVKITEKFYAKFTKARQAQLDAYLRPTFERT